MDSRRVSLFSRGPTGERAPCFGVPGFRALRQRFCQRCSLLLVHRRGRRSIRMADKADAARHVLARCAWSTETFRHPYEQRTLLTAERSASADVSLFLYKPAPRPPDVRERYLKNVLIIFREKRQYICVKLPPANWPPALLHLQEVRNGLRPCTMRKQGESLLSFTLLSRSAFAVCLPPAKAAAGMISPSAERGWTSSAGLAADQIERGQEETAHTERRICLMARC